MPDMGYSTVMATQTISEPQRQILTDLIAGLSVRHIADRRGHTRQRCQAQIDTLRIKGLLRKGPPDNCLCKEIHPQDSRNNPWPPPSRYIRVLSEPNHEVVIRSVLLPRVDGLELPHALPETYAVSLSRPGYNGSLNWEISRRRRWSVTDTLAIHDDWKESAPQHLIIPPWISLDDDQIDTLTLAIAWAVNTEAILYRTDI